MPRFRGPSRSDTDLTNSRSQSAKGGGGDLLAIVRDQTAPNPIEREACDARLRIALGLVDTAVFNQDRDLRYTWIQQPHFGNGPADLIGKTDRDVLPSAGVDEVIALKRRAMDAGVRVRKEVALGTGSGKRWFDLAVEPLRNESGEVVGLTGAASDITDRKRAEEEIRLLQTMTLAASQAPDFSGTLEVVLRSVGETTRWSFGEAWVPGADGTSLECLKRWSLDFADERRLDRFTARWRFRPGEGLVGRAWSSRRPEWIRSIAHQAECPRRDIAEELGIHAGMAIPLLAGEAVVAVVAFYVPESKDEDERLLSLVSAVAAQIGSVVLRRRAEEALRASEDQVRLLLDSTAEGIYGLDLQGNCTFANKSCLRMLGYRDQPAVVGKNMHDLIHHTHGDGTRYPVEDCQIYRAGLKGEGAFIDDEVFWREDGTSFPVEYRSFPMRRNGARIGAAVSFVDITERKRAAEALRKSEEQLRHAQKMEAVGQLAGGIAHDFNNVLAVILSNCSLVLDQVGAQPQLREDVQEIQQCAERAAGLTRQLLAFSRRQVLAVRVIDLNSVVQDMEKLLRRVIGEHIDLVTSLEASLGSVKTDPSQMEQIILNLAVNARDAMPDGGRLTIETANVLLDRPTHAGPARHTMLRVTDTGHGMDAVTRARIFEPFFTTKERGKGTGLGLSTVYRIVQQSGGLITVESEPGRGASFEVLLPCVDAEPAPAFAHAAHRTASPSETILIVDDDPLVRSSLGRSLKAKGYEILQAASGAAALAACDLHEGRIHLLLTDVVIPGMSGSDLAEKIRQRRPDVRILFMSGYADHAMLDEAVLEDGWNFLQKPFTADVLVRKIGDVLERCPAGA
jgi:PAS domain S-box-containing protein